MGQSVNSIRLATVSPEGLHWLLRRNCSVSPRQVGWVFAWLCAVSLAVAGFFWLQGATLVLPFTAVELTAVACAFLVYARHATDREWIGLRGESLVVEQEAGGRTHRCEFARYAVQVDADRGRDRLVEVRCGGQTVRVGRHLRADLRPVLAREIRQALRGG